MEGKNLSFVLFCFLMPGNIICCNDGSVTLTVKMVDFIKFVVVQSLSHVRLFAIPWSAAGQAALAFTISWVCSNSCPLSRWCQPIISSSVASISCLQSFPASGKDFLWVGFSYPVAKVLDLQLQHQSFQWIFKVDFLWDWLVWSCCPRDSQESSPAPQFVEKGMATHFSILALRTPWTVWTDFHKIKLQLTSCRFLIPVWLKGEKCKFQGCWEHLLFRWLW